MPIPLAISIFVGSFTLSVVSSIVLAKRLEQWAVWLRFSQSLLGIVAALGADAPEIASAVTALHAGDHDLGLGIVLGSNIFNLAALLGLSALVAKKVTVARRTLMLDGGVAVGVMLIVTTQLYGWLPGSVALILVGVVMVPYITLAATPPKRLRWVAARLGMGDFVSRAIADADEDAERGETPPQPSWADRLGVLPALVSVVVASIGMVKTAVVMGNAWHVPGVVVGTLVLATLTGIPNIVTAVQLARRGRGSAVLSESLNSNTLNLVVGASLPAVLLGLRPLSPQATVALWWMVVMTLLTLGLCFFRGGLGRAGGWVLVAVYAAFVVVVVLQR